MPSQDYAHVADIYDIYVNTTFDIPYWLNLAEQTSGEILELMCGTGRVTMPLLEAGYSVTALDNSPELLAVLRDKLSQKNYAAEVIQADVCQFDLGKQFDLIILPFNAFAELQTKMDQLQALRMIYQHLNEGGLFVCTLHNPPVRLQSVDEQLHFVASYPLPDGKLLFWLYQRYAKDEKRVDVLQIYEEYDSQSFLRTKRMQEMSFRIISRNTFAHMVQMGGFQVSALYGDYQNKPYDEQTSPFMLWHLTR